jgi:hypothetical protein
MIKLVIAGIVVVLTLFASPFVACIYRDHQFEASVRLKIDSPDCQKTIPGLSTECCQCFLAFDGIRLRDSIQFKGTGLKYSYDSEHRIFQITGEGEIKSGRNSIELRSGQIYINGQQLPVRSTPLRVLVKEDGHLVNEFCDVSW